jgi:hypothetical protein
MVITRAFAKQAELAAGVDAVKSSLGPDLVHLSYALGDDWSGDPSIFFKVVISDRASQESEMLAATRRIRDAVLDQIRPLEEWGVLPYFQYRSKAENDARPKEDAWV